MRSESTHKVRFAGVTAIFSRSTIIKVTLLLLLSLFVTVVYVTYFQHAPPAELLKNNRRRVSLSSGKRQDFGASLFKSSEDGEDESDAKEIEDPEKDIDNDVSADVDEDVEENDDDESDKDDGKNDVISHKKRGIEEEDTIKMAGYWEELLKQSNLVPIGAVYDKCEGSRLQIGAVALLEDKVNGGIMARTYINITLKTTVDGGQLNIESRYNGRAMYDNYWELCEVEDDLPDEEKTFTCPFDSWVVQQGQRQNHPKLYSKGPIPVENLGTRPRRQHAGLRLLRLYHLMWSAGSKKVPVGENVKHKNKTLFSRFETDSYVQRKRETFLQCFANNKHNLEKTKASKVSGL